MLASDYLSRALWVSTLLKEAFKCKSNLFTSIADIPHRPWAL